MPQATVTALYHYPVKSCRGIALNTARVTPYGLEQDRHWMIVDADGTFLSQREYPKLALVEALPDGSTLTLRAPNMPDLVVTAAEERPLAVAVWNDQGIAQDCGAAAAAWFSDYLGVSCRLVTLGERFRRPVDPAYDRYQTEVAFSDGYPFLLLSEASLTDLNSRLEKPLAMNRFRPNIVVGGCEPYAEDDWQRLQIGELIFHGVKRCPRCAITTVDQEQGQAAGKEPLRTLARYRRGDNGKVFFGQNLIHESKTGVLRVGDPVTVLAS